MFNHKVARRELKHYLKQGPDDNTRLLLEALTGRRVEGLTLLDIGGGIGVIQHELLHAGVESATSVDASAAYARTASQEAKRRGFAARVTYHHGNFVDLAAQIDPADIVTLDRVICCFDDMPALVRLSAEHARRFYGLVYPRDTWMTRLFVAVQNFGLWLIRNPFRTFIHPTQEVHALIESLGLRQTMHHQGTFWQVALYER